MELDSFNFGYTKITAGVMLVDGDYKKLNIESTLIERVGLLVGYHDSIVDFKSKDYSQFIKNDDSFKVKCKDRMVCIELGQYIKDSTKAKVSLDEPDKIFFVYRFNNKILVFLDTTGDNKLTMRGYSSTNNEAITSDTASAMVMFSGWDNNKILLDPFCNQGYIIIEALLQALKIGPGTLRTKSFDFEVKQQEVKKIKLLALCSSNDMNNIKNAKQNAKLAGVFRYIRFGFNTLNDLDYKIGENKIDYIISVLPKKVDIDKLFFQLEYIMKKDGVVVILTKKDIDAYKKYSFKIIKETTIYNKKLIKLVRT